MFWFITGIIVTIGLFVGLGFYEDHCDLKWTLSRKQFLALFGLILCLFSFAAKVPANSVGIVYSPFGGTRDETFTEGIHFKSPFDKVYNISTEVQTTTVENLTTQTKDAQFLTSNLDIKYRVNTEDAYLVFKQFRTLNTMSKQLITPTTQRVLELITTKYNVIDILGESRSAVYTELEAGLATEFAKYGIEFYSISIVDMDAGEALERAITEEAVAKKAVETAAQNLLKTETEAKQQAITAQAAQDAAKIEAETKIIQAEAERKANELLNHSLTEDILQKEWIEKWDGKMPTYYAGSDNGFGIMVNG